MRLALFEPDIAGNTGTLIRLGACLGLPVDIIEPCGFAFSLRALKRSGMDYLGNADVTVHADWEAFRASRPERLVLLTTRASCAYTDAAYDADDILLVGRESAGVPDAVHEAAGLAVRIPLQTAMRSLNVAVAAAMVAGEGLRQTGICRMIELDDEQRAAQAWFRSLRDSICAEFEAIEDELGGDRPAGRFERAAWDRVDHNGAKGGGGVMSVMRGRVFEKVGVNISTVGGAFDPEFAKSINGAAEDPRFFATGISLVAHPVNPHVPAVHMNCRMLATTKRWFGGGADLNPAIPQDADTADFKARLKQACDAHAPDYWDRFTAWCDDYFFIKHRGVNRGVGGIFYDHLDSGDRAADLAFTQDVGLAFLDSYPALVRRRMRQPASAEDRARQLAYRGLYAEFNLVYDRGTLFGLKTGGNIEAILMSLPPLATWE